MAGLSLCAALSAVLASCNPTPDNSGVDGRRLYVDLAKPSVSIDATAAAAVINDYRRLNGLSPVSVDPALNRFAEAQARAIAGKESLIIPGGRSLRDRLAEAGQRPAQALENLSAGYYSMSDAFSGWRGSKPNDATLRLREARRMGIATIAVPGSKYGVYWALVMASD